MSSFQLEPEIQPSVPHIHQSLPTEIQFHSTYCYFLNTVQQKSASNCHKKFPGKRLEKCQGLSQEWDHVLRNYYFINLHFLITNPSAVKQSKTSLGHRKYIADAIARSLLLACFFSKILVLSRRKLVPSTNFPLGKFKAKIIYWDN